MVQYVFLIVLLVSLFASAVVSWWRFLAHRKPDGGIWRKRVFVLGLAGNTLSIVLFTAFTMQALLISKGVLRSRDLIASYKYFIPLELSFAAIICGPFGKGLPRIMVVISGLVLSFLWLNYGAIGL